jgi:hypothetical protein
VLQELTDIAADPFSGGDTAARRRTEPTSLPRHRATVSVRPRRFHLARHLPIFLCELSPPVPHTWSPARRRPWAGLKSGAVRLFLIVFQLI